MADLITVTEASIKYKLSTGFLRRLLRRGTLQGRKSGNVWLLSVSSLMRYLSTPRQPGPKPKRRRSSHKHLASKSQTKR